MSTFLKFSNARSKADSVIQQCLGIIAKLEKIDEQKYFSLPVDVEGNCVILNFFFF